MIPIRDLEGALHDLELNTSDWYKQAYGDSLRLCLESEASRRLMWAVLEHMSALYRMGTDYTVPLVLLAGTMLQIGYGIGKKQAETEVLEGWMKL